MFYKNKYCYLFLNVYDLLAVVNGRLTYNTADVRARKDEWRAWTDVRVLALIIRMTCNLFYFLLYKISNGSKT